MLAGFWLASSYGQTSIPPVIETREDLEIAATNFPERVPKGTEIKTLLGNQIIPGSLPQDFRKNQQIFNDIAELNAHINSIMRMIADLSVKPKLIADVQKAMDQLKQMVSNAGIRYNFSPSFSIRNKEISEIMEDLRASPPPATSFMLFKARLEVIMAVLENALKTKLVGTYPL